MNGVSAVLGTQANLDTDVIAVDGVRITRPTIRVLLLNKPCGYVTTRRDVHAPDTVMALVPEIPGLHPVGRLDKDSSGLLLLTNDGSLTYALTHPRHQVAKTYEVRVAGVPNILVLNILRKGVPLEDGMTAPAGVVLLDIQPTSALLRITLHEGRKRQIRRMCAILGHPVQTLQRVGIGSLTLDDLQEGCWRDLTAEEVCTLRGQAARRLSP